MYNVPKKVPVSVSFNILGIVTHCGSVQYSMRRIFCSVLCAVFSAQYSLHSILCAVFTLPCAVFSVQYSASPSHQINFNYCTDLSSRLVAPRKSIYCGIIILQNISRISILVIFVNYCKCCKSSWLGINLMLSENCEIAPVMTK